jgi:hypothetical protein
VIQHQQIGIQALGENGHRFRNIARFHKDLSGNKFGSTETGSDDRAIRKRMTTPWKLATLVRR